MPSFRECPACRALLTDDQLFSTVGVCPYCSRPLVDDGDQNPYAPPKSSLESALEPLYAPRDFGGKLRMAFGLLFGQLALFALLVLTVWIPGNVLIELISAGNANQPDAMATFRLNNLIELIFSPIYAGGVITALARRMNGQKTSYGEAIRAGFHHWGRLFGARFVAGLLIGIGLIALIVPGIILAIRYSLIDDVVVLEGAGASESRRRSTWLVAGKSLKILLAGALSITLILIFSIGLQFLMESIRALDNPVMSILFACVVDVFAVFFTCFLFLFYWEAREEEAERESARSKAFAPDAL